MQSEKQYIDLYNETQGMIKQHSCDVLNRVRDKAFEDFKTQGFPTKKVERYKYTDIPKLFAPDYGLNLQRLKMPINPYEEFKCDVPNLSTSIYFVVNDQFYTDQLPKTQLNDGIVVDSFSNAIKTHSEIITKYYAKLADTAKDALTAFNTNVGTRRLVCLCSERRKSRPNNTSYQYSSFRCRPYAESSHPHRTRRRC